jgi:hypothetical protein
VDQLGHLLQRHRCRENQFTLAVKSKTNRFGGGLVNHDLGEAERLGGPFAGGQTKLGSPPVESVFGTIVLPAPGPNRLSAGLLGADAFAPGIRLPVDLGFHEHLHVACSMLPDQISGAEMRLVERTP